MPLQESEAIPYAANDLRGERLLILAPHPDDEVIGCGGLLALHLRDGRPVRVAIATDGAEAGNAEVREEESQRALSILGTVAIDFLHFRDRHLEEDLQPLKARLREILTQFKPDLIAVPSPVEIHPDHAALSRAFCELIQSDASLFAALAVARVAFYEVGYPIRPNTLVDITSVAAKKYAAITCHTSQLAVRDYVSYARGLNAWRAMTLAPGMLYAEGYWVGPLPALRTTPFSALREQVGAPPSIAIESEPLPVSVVVRTKDRPALLRQAVDSIRATQYPAEIVVVNDGGKSPDIRDIRLVNLAQSAGRSEAMNRGVRAAKSAYIAFLDDDDLFYPEHIATLTAAARDSQHPAWYSDAVSAFVRTGASGELETHSRMRIFGSDFDRDLLLLDNFIPLPTILVPRETYLDMGGFDPAFDLFEDWDFLIRLSARGAFVHVPKVTCEIRHVEGAGSITLESPEGSERFREAKLQIWKKHAELINEKVFANVLEHQKRRLTSVLNDAVDARGLQNHLEIDIARLQREKATLGGEIQELHNRVNEALMRISHLEGANAEIRNNLAFAEADRHEKGVRLKDLRAAHAESEQTNAAMFAEVGRLQDLLDTIFKSKTWKLHEIVERMKRASVSRVLLVCPEPLGHGQPAGVGIRFLEMQKALAADGHRVTLLSPPVTPEALLQQSNDADVAVVQGHIANDFFAHARAIPTVVDLYDPFIIENLHYYESRGAEVFQHDHTTVLNSLLRGDFFLCASRSQRLFWLGMMLAAGRLNPIPFDSDPSLESLIAIAPFGVPPARPRATPAEPRVLFGGIYDWYDPILAIDAVAIARESLPNISLTFNKHPNPSITPQGKTAEAIDYVRKKKYDAFVRFEPWFEYERRAEFLDRFAIALLTFPQSLETDLSMRTRVYDFLWGGLPIVSSPAPGTDEILARYACGVTVDSTAPRAFSDAILQTFSKQAALRDATRRFVAEHQWPEALKPLREFCRQPRLDANKDAFAVQLQVPQRPASILERLKRRIGGTS